MKLFSSMLFAPQSNTSQSLKDEEDLLDMIPKIIGEEINKGLLKLFTLEELKNVLFSLPLDKALGPDGFIAIFFQK